jgi:hypothetical protein
MDVEHRHGARIIAGSYPQAGVELAVTDPWGNRTTTVTGSKPEYGPGGFEVLAPNVATYTLDSPEKSFEVSTHEGATIVTITRTAPEPSPPEAPLDLPEPEPPPEAPPDAAPEPAPLDEGLLDQILERLERIIRALEERLS